MNKLFAVCVLLCSLFTLWHMGRSILGRIFSKAYKQELQRKMENARRRREARRHS